MVCEMKRNVAAACCLLGVVHCSSARHVTPYASSSEQASWTAPNQDQLARWLAEIPASKDRRVAVFDWDNTMIKGDVGDMLFAHMLHGERFVAPRTFADTSPYLTSDAVIELDRVCLVSGTEQRMRTHGTACGALMSLVYDKGEISSGVSAFVRPPNARRIMPAYAWAATLLHGYSDAEVRAMAEQALQGALAAPLPNGIRYYEPMRALVEALQQAGVEVWIVSASAEPLVEAAAAGIGIAAERVVGVRVRQDDNGRRTAQLLPCGDDPHAMPFMDGKRCWINQEVWGVQGGAAWQPYEQVVALAAGDADTDATFLSDAARRIVIDRQKPELTCRAHLGDVSRWLVQPMFIEPLPHVASTPCADQACIAEDGSRVNCRLLVEATR